jgi:hypothetical protein
VDGSLPGDTLAVVTVDSGELPFDGGSRSFTLIVDREGPSPKTIQVRVNIRTDKTGAAAFKVSPEGNLERLDTGTDAVTGFQAAFEYVARNARADTEYLIRVEQHETSLPKFILAFGAENVTLRLRGTKEGPWTLQHGGLSGVSPSGASGGHGFFTIGLNQDSAGAPFKTTFIVGSNITIKGLGTTVYDDSLAIGSALNVRPNATLILEKGSLLTDWYTATGSGSRVRCPLYVEADSNAAGDRAKHGSLRIEGGSITNCTFITGGSPPEYGLVYVDGSSNDLAPGSIYKAASTTGNPIILSGNSNNLLLIIPRTGSALRRDLGAPVEVSLP